MNNNLDMQELKKELDRVSTRWLYLHQRLVWILVLLSVCLELIMTYVLNQLDGFVKTTLADYFVKYLLVPALLNLTIAAVCCILCRSLAIRTRCYITTLSMAAICTILYAVHNIFPVLKILFALSILLTATYGDRILTSVSAFTNIVAYAVCDLLISCSDSKVPIWNDSQSFIEFLLALILLGGVYWCCMAIIQYQQEKNYAIAHQTLEQRRLRQELGLDNLTRLGNRHALREALDRMTQEAVPCIFAMLDLDHFKQINDEYGHLAGDRCLRFLAHQMADVFQGNQLFRYGGDEFCILFHSDSLEDASRACHTLNERLGSSFKELGIVLECSFGLAQYRPGMSAHEVIRAADQALYDLKEKKEAHSPELTE